MKELSVLLVYKQDLFVQCLFLCKPLIIEMTGVFYLWLLSDREVSWVHPRSDLTYLLLLYANRGRGKSGLFKSSNIQFLCWLEWKEGWPGNPETWILGSALY